MKHNCDSFIFAVNAEYTTSRANVSNEWVYGFLVEINGFSWAVVAGWRGGSPCLRERVAGVSFLVVVPAASGSAGRASSSPVAHGNDLQGWFLWSFPPDAADPRA
jgi:hypothetical protein